MTTKCSEQKEEKLVIGYFTGDKQHCVDNKRELT